MCSGAALLGQLHLTALSSAEFSSVSPHRPMLALSQFSILLFVMKGKNKFLGNLQSKKSQVQLRLMQTDYIQQAQ